MVPMPSAKTGTVTVSSDAAVSATIRIAASLFILISFHSAVVLETKPEGGYCGVIADVGQSQRCLGTCLDVVNRVVVAGDCHPGAVSGANLILADRVSASLYPGHGLVFEADLILDK